MNLAEKMLEEKKKIDEKNSELEAKVKAMFETETTQSDIVERFIKHGNEASYNLKMAAAELGCVGYDKDEIEREYKKTQR